jgi:hypothetical protein
MKQQMETELAQVRLSPEHEKLFEEAVAEAKSLNTEGAKRQKELE